MIRGARLGKRYEDVTFDKVQVTTWNREAIKTAKRLVGGERLWIVLFGGVGRGKTHLLAAIANEMDRKWPMAKVLYWPVMELIEALRKAIDGGFNPEPECLEAHVLLLDDLGVETRTEWSIEAIHRIVDYRYREMKPLVIATNLQPEGIEARYGARVARRLDDEAVLCWLDGPRWSKQDGKDG